MTGTASAPAAAELLEVEVQRIAPDPGQPRTRFDEAELAELAAGIGASSLLQPIVITPNTTHPETGTEYLVLFGERRLRAAVLAGRRTVPAILRTDPLAPAERILLQIEENEQRSPLSLYERALAYRRALEISGLSPAELARRSRISKSALSKYLSLAAADGFLAEALAEHRIHHLEAARAFARLPARYQKRLLARSRESGDPITISRVERAAAAADAEAELAGQTPAAGGGEGVEGEEDDGSPAPAEAADPPVQLELRFSAFCTLVRRRGAEPVASPARARGQLLALLARDSD